MKKPLKEIVIDRSKWQCGTGFENSALLSDNGLMCCLGIRSKMAGVPKKALRNIESPAHSVHNRMPAWMTHKYDESVDAINSSITDDMMVANDDQDLSQKERESLLRGLARKIGERWIFKGKRPVKKYPKIED